MIGVYIKTTDKRPYTTDEGRRTLNGNKAAIDQRVEDCKKWREGKMIGIPGSVGR